MSKPHVLYEVTCRCMQQRFLLRPSKRLNALTLGALAMAMQNFPGIRVYVFTFASNHYHIILSAPNHRVLSAFMCHFNTNLAKEAGRLHGWSGPFWGRRYQALEIKDRAMLLERVAYVLSHGVKEDLVMKCQQWPGANCVKNLLHDEPLFGTWVDRASLYNANRNLERCSEKTFERTLEIKLTRLPCFESLTPREHRAEIEEIIKEIHRRAARNRRKKNKRVLGAKRVCRQNPLGRPSRVNKRPAPKCHASNLDLWQDHLLGYRKFEQQYRTAYSYWKSGYGIPEFPSGSFLPGGHYLDEPHPPPPARAAS